MSADADRSGDRAAMVEQQLARRGISDPRVLEAMREVPREAFLPRERRYEAYADRAVALGSGQTVSQPWIVAAICQALELSSEDRLLEIGTGSGYSAAVLARLGAEVVSIERLAELADLARGNLAALGIDNVEVICADGSVGLPERAPWDAIAVHAATPGEPQQLLAQLAPGGRLVAPIASVGERGRERDEYLVRWTRASGAPAPEAGRGLDAPEGGRFSREMLVACRFVPLIGEAGYPDDRAIDG
jgi:protein-L-isoaspartate(D-aspartate) O-methyltransferase